MEPMKKLVNNLKSKLLNLDIRSLVEDDSNVIEHTVSKGDTLYSLSLKYQTTVKKIISLNPEITNPNLIKVGDILKIYDNRLK